MNTIWIFSIEPIDTRYTGEWHEYIPAMLKKDIGSRINVVQVDGIQKNTIPTPGAFLNFSDTNYWKSSQLCKFLDHYNNGETQHGDKFLFTDAWNTSILQIKYMSDLMNLDWQLHGFWHAGSYDPQDFLGRLIKDKSWTYNTERALFYALDCNWMATQFHANMLADVLFETEEFEWERTGWPMDYMAKMYEMDDSRKENIIVFPHRIAPEKQVDIFRDLEKSLPQYQFVVCQDKKLTKQEYHELLSRSKLLWSANLQETLGISPWEGALHGVAPLLPDRLSYSEMYDEQWLYPSEWTESFEAYLEHKVEIISKITELMENYDNNFCNYIKLDLAQKLLRKYFTATNLIERLLS